MVASSWVLDASYTVLREVPWTEAMNYIVAGEAWILRPYEDQFIHSQHLTIPKPMWIVKNRFSIEEYRHLQILDLERASFESVMKRDKGRCIYNPKHKATTIDHVIPRSRGGQNVWRNLVACCRPCNQYKADRTPEEAGMKLFWEPAHVDPLEKVQRHVWRFIEHMGAEEFAALPSSTVT